MKTRQLKVNKRLVEVIRGGGYELTDERFFDLLKESSDYLGTAPFLDRIIEWQNQLIHNLFREEVLAEDLGEDFQKEKRIEESKKATRNLQKIGTTLGHVSSRSGRPRESPSALKLVGTFELYKEILGDFVKRSNKLQHRYERKRLFEQEFPEWTFADPYAKKDCRTASSLARRVIAKKYNVPNTKLRALIKSGKELLKQTNDILKSHPKHKSK